MFELNKKLWGERPFANSIFHSVGGVGIGLLLANWGLGSSLLGWLLLGVSIAGHVWARSKK